MKTKKKNTAPPPADSTIEPSEQQPEQPSPSVVIRAAKRTPLEQAMDNGKRILGTLEKLLATKRQRFDAITAELEQLGREILAHEKQIAAQKAALGIE